MCTWHEYCINLPVTISLYNCFSTLAYKYLNFLSIVVTYTVAVQSVFYWGSFLCRTHTHTHSPVDVYFASASYDRTARLWATDLVYPLRIFAGHTAGVDVRTSVSLL